MANQKIEYRTANESDISGMARIRAKEWRTEAFWQHSIKEYLNGASSPQQALAARIVFVATQDEEVIGLIAGHLTKRFGCEGELQWITVDPVFRRSGVATELLQKLASWFEEKNARHICVNCAPDNAVGLKFYKRHGAEKLTEYFLAWKDISSVAAVKPS